MARSLGVSLKRLDGWEPCTTSTVTGWDDQGRPSVWVSKPEQEWDRRERSLMLALTFHEAGLCGRCGQHLSHSMDPNTDPDRPEATQQWIAVGPDECHSCKALVRAEQALANDKDGGGDKLLPFVVHAPALVAKKPRTRKRIR